MTGMRPGEWLGSNFSDKPQWIWKQVDLAKGRLHLPAVTHKTGQRPGKDRAIYLCKEAVKVLKAMPGTVT